MEKLMKLVSTSTWYGGPSCVLYLKNSAVGVFSLPGPGEPSLSCSARLRGTPLKSQLQQRLGDQPPDSELSTHRGGSSQPRPCLLYRLTRSQAW